jgi:F-type H+-transporting ATPase subunit b
MPQLDTSTYSAQLFWLIVLFSILFLAIQFYFEPKIRGIFKRRELKLRKKIILAKQMKKEIEKIEQTICEKEQYAHDHMRSLTHDAEIESQKAILKKKQALSLLQTNTLKALEQELERNRDSFSASSKEEKMLTHLLAEKILGFSLCESVYEEAVQKISPSHAL